MAFTSEDLKRFESYEKVHLKGASEDITPSEKIELLQKKDRNKWYMLIVNILAILFFGYSFYFDITNLSDTVFTVLLVIFTINVGLIFLQKKQIGELIEYYRSV